MSLCYTRDELRELSDRTRRSAVIRWLQARRVPFVPDADGWPKVLRGAILDQAQPKPETAPEPRLNFS